MKYRGPIGWGDQSSGACAGPNAICTRDRPDAGSWRSSEPAFRAASGRFGSSQTAATSSRTRSPDMPAGPATSSGATRGRSAAISEARSANVGRGCQQLRQQRLRHGLLGGGRSGNTGTRRASTHSATDPAAIQAVGPKQALSRETRGRYGRNRESHVQVSTAIVTKRIRQTEHPVRWGSSNSTMRLRRQCPAIFSSYRPVPRARAAARRGRVGRSTSPTRRCALSDRPPQQPKPTPTLQRRV